MRWPWQPEMRERYTDQAIAALVDHAAYGTTKISPGDTAPVMAAAIEWSSAACRLRINPAVPALTAHLAQIGSDLVRRGRWAALIDRAIARSDYRGRAETANQPGDQGHVNQRQLRV